MQPAAKQGSGSTQLLTIRGEGGAWGIPSSAVASVEQPRAADATAPLDLLTLLGVATPLGAERLERVLVLDVAGERLELLVHGALELADTAAGALLQLPAAVQAVTPLVSHLAIIDGKPSLFVVSPERLLQAARRASTTPHDSDRGSSC